MPLPCSLSFICDDVAEIPHRAWSCARGNRRLGGIRRGAAYVAGSRNIERVIISRRASGRCVYPQTLRGKFAAWIFVFFQSRSNVDCGYFAVVGAPHRHRRNLYFPSRTRCNLAFDACLSRDWAGGLSCSARCLRSHGESCASSRNRRCCLFAPCMERNERDGNRARSTADAARYGRTYPRARLRMPALEGSAVAWAWDSRSAGVYVRRWGTYPRLGYPCDTAR